MTGSRRRAAAGTPARSWRASGSRSGWRKSAPASPDRIAQAEFWRGCDLGLGRALAGWYEASHTEGVAKMAAGRTPETVVVDLDRSEVALVIGEDEDKGMSVRVVAGGEVPDGATELPAPQEIVLALAMRLLKDPDFHDDVLDWYYEHQDEDDEDEDEDDEEPGRKEDED